MKKFPKKFLDRVQKALKNYQGIVASIKERDVSEADTVTVVKDILADIFGYDKYTELTSEQQIRGTYCDLAIKINNKISFLIEVKAAGISLNESHIRQSVNYGAHQGIEWVFLTNAVEWRMYKIEFSQPIKYEEVARFAFSELNLKKEDDLEKMFLMAREGLSSNAIQDFHQQSLVFNRYTIAQILISEPISATIRKEMRKLFPEIKIDESQLLDMILNDILKREVIEGDRVKEVQSMIRKVSNKMDREKKKGEPSSPSIKNDIVPSNQSVA